MNFVISLLILALFGFSWKTSEFITQFRLNNLVSVGKIPFGPLPDRVKNYYCYDGIHAAFDPQIDIKRADEFSKSEFEQIILNSLDEVSKKNLKDFLPFTLGVSVDYQIDPFWIISVMMVESGFDPDALSSKNAHGLMQIRSDTAEHLFLLMRKKINENQIKINLHQPNINIEIGIFYLKKLLQNFRLNYKLATTAYNLGPNKLKNLLDDDNIDPGNFSYYIKVQESYKLLTKSYLASLREKSSPFLNTFVYRSIGWQGQNISINLKPLHTIEYKAPKMLTSENLKQNISNSLTF